MTDEEKVLVREYKNTDLFRLCRKVISDQYNKTCGKLVRVEREDLPTVQGEIRALNAIYNLFMGMGEEKA